MTDSRYKKLQRIYVVVILLVSFTPLFLLGGIMYYQVSKTYRTKIEEQIRYRVISQADTIDLFLKERTAILAAIADTVSFNQIINEKTLLKTFELINLRAGAFVDLGVIDQTGQHRAYVGPYDLKGLNYYNQPWFGEVMAKGLYVSDVFTGFRAFPHFIIAIRRQEDKNSWILRATIDPDIFAAIVRSAQIGKTGDAFLVNKEGLFQTTPRFSGGILGKSDIDPTAYGGLTTINEEINSKGEKRLTAGRWLKNKTWLLIVSQDVSEEMGSLLKTRNQEIAIILMGSILIILTTVITTRYTVSKLKNADARMNELNAQLLQSDKLAALGKMAAGVAHEINNPLAVILQKTGWMEDLLEDEAFQKSKEIEEYRVSLKKIEEHVERARKVVHNMLGFARKMEPRLEDVDVNQTLKQTISLLENYARLNNIELRAMLSADIPIIASDQSQLQQVFLNIISNAIDAIGRDGLVEVKSAVNHSTIDVTISDNGPGIPEEQQKSIFDPFFTTKQTGKGTGLGLWITYNIIEKLGGSISFHSETGKGTTFTVKIPKVPPTEK
ncbi:conserved hypothetical protein [uncultured Desulfobacterium sp.]|uniref:histidine kinase n=1 Tax=uncultured Desulfobacterium sp. TaxID=201089 RepID=A0A445MYE5_9BACT|nr:conserved hypothetical protein [uncultured Desulfobacterium sp.]